MRGQRQRQPVLVTPDGTSKLTFLDSPPVGAVAKTRSNEESDAPYSNIDELLSRRIAELEAPLRDMWETRDRKLNDKFGTL